HHRRLPYFPTRRSSDLITTPPIEMISLMTNEATKAPTMFPRPPSTQIMKVSGPNAAPKNGCTEYWMMSSAPASPAIAQYSVHPRSEEHTSELQSRFERV